MRRYLNSDLTSTQNVLTNAAESKGKDWYGYRAELIDLVKKTQLIDLRLKESPGIIIKGGQ